VQLELLPRHNLDLDLLPCLNLFINRRLPTTLGRKAMKKIWRMRTMALGQRSLVSTLGYLLLRPNLVPKLGLRTTLGSEAARKIQQLRGSFRRPRRFVPNVVYQLVGRRE